MTRALVAAILGLAAAGCGTPAVPVSGTVTLKGQPLSAGIITFEPAPGSGTTGAGAVAGVKDGKFDVPATKNLLPGKYVARVSPYPPASGEDLKAAPPQFKPWETTVELAPGAAPLALDVPDAK